MRTVALLPMKGNSERVPGKNFKLLEGRPLFEHTLSSLLSVSNIDRVVINTDVPDVILESQIARDSRVMIRMRDAEIVGDYVSMNDVIANDVSNVEADCYVMTHSTNPFLSPRTIEACLKSYSEALLDGYDSLFTVSKVQARLYNVNAEAFNHNPGILMPTQHLEPLFEENSLLYIFSNKSFAATKARIGRVPMMFETDCLESIDIDTPGDWALAEVVARGLRGRV